MSIQAQQKSAFLFLIVAVLTATTSLADTSRMATYDHDGETYFALSVTAELTGDAQPCDVVVLFDTSASQTGAYRADALACLTTLLSQLKGDHTVQLFALDLEAVPMHDELAAAKSPAVSAGLTKLESRLPLGSTDLAAGLNMAAKQLASSGQRAARVVYIGDGISKANLLDHTEFQQVINQLQQQRVTVSSYAIGPQRDVQLLSTIANHTGGNVFVDAEKVTGQEAGTALATATQAPVFWPTRANLPDAIVEQFPRTIPPLRGDRDTILVGVAHRNDMTLELTGDVNGTTTNLKWQLVPESSSEDFGYLPRLVEIARRDNGLSLPTAGSSALREVRRVLLSGADRLTQLSGRALATGDTKSAARLAEAALATDPGNMRADVIKNAVQRKTNKAQVSGTQFEIQSEDSPTGDGVVVDEGLVLEQPLEFQIVPDGNVEMQSAPLILDDVPASFEEENGRLIDSVEAKRRAREGVLRAEVRTGIAAARDVMSSDPEGSVRDLKVMLENVKRAPDIDGEMRLQLRNQVEAAIRAGKQRQFEKGRRDAVAANNRALATERQMIADATRREEEQLVQVLDRFNSLMREGRYSLAQEAALAAEELAPTRPEAIVAVGAARYGSHRREMLRIRDLKYRAFWATLATVEESHIPFPDEPPLIYPPAEEWEALTARRKKYASVDLATVKESEEKIFEQLDRPTQIDLFETALSDAMDILADYHDINIELDTAALDILGVDSGIPITKTYNGISLRSALRLILREHDLTYVVRDEVLMITSEEEAEQELVTRVYPVGDLVLPITSGFGFGLGGSVGGFGGGGGGGGGLGGGGGGFGGGGGGGFGGGGGGGGFGGGGQFAIQDEIKLGVKAAAPQQTTKATPAAPAEARQVATGHTGRVIKLAPSAGDAAGAWNDLFARQANLAADQQIAAIDVRATVRQAMRQNDYDQVVHIIHGALANGYPQPWMFEAMGLALQAKQAPKKEIERALMSAVDFATTVEELYYAASYLARIGLESRSIQLMKDVASANPSDPAPYSLALRLARRIGDKQAMQWAAVGVLSQAWPQGTEDIAQAAERTAKATLEELSAAGRTDEAEKFASAVNDALERDVYATVTWTGDADFDILMQEPGGTVCSLQQQRTTGGGVLLADASTSKDKPEAQEVYVCPKGFVGDYKLMIRPIYGKADGGKVTVQVGRHYGSAQHQTMKKQVAIADEPVVVAFELDEGRRTESIEEAQVATITKSQRAMDQAVLGQVTGVSNADDAIAAALIRDRGLVGRLRSAVGFRPVITVFPEGTNFTVTAVISADRRYVRVSPQPTFSGITQVQTFNFFTGDTGTDTGGGTDVTGGGGGGGTGGTGGGLGGGGFGGSF